jgi:predicted lipid-binding transport protein (Tim44 family)
MLQKMKYCFRFNSLISACLVMIIALAPTFADARVGGGGSQGSRGARTFKPAPATPTAPAPRPIERSMTPPTNPNQQDKTGQSPQLAQRPGASPSFFQRNPFLSGLLGGFLGAGLAGMLFGHGFWGGGFAGLLGTLIQLALIAGLIYFAVAFFRRRPISTARPAAYAGPAGFEELTPHAGGAQIPLHSPTARDDVGLRKEDFDAFERSLVQIQAAWSKADLAGMRRWVTPEMLSYLSEQLAANASKGVENRVENVKFTQGDLAEAWSEGNTDYATVAMRWLAQDYTVESASGRVVEGDPTNAVEAAEVWTFMRSRGGQWLLSAIQQV